MRALELAGTPGYMAPEILATTEKGATFASDIYAYAVILNEYLFTQDEEIAPNHRAAINEICEHALREDPATRTLLPAILSSLRIIQDSTNNISPRSC